MASWRWWPRLRRPCGARQVGSSRRLVERRRHGERGRRPGAGRRAARPARQAAGGAQRRRRHRRLRARRRGLVGLVAGLELGQNTLAVVANRRSSAPAKDRLTLVNHPITGPIFSGPQQRPFVCQTIQAGLGEPLVDNQAGEGFRVLNPDGSTAGWSLDCSAETTVDYLYRTTGGAVQALPADGSRPADMATTTRGRARPWTSSSAASAGRSTASSTRSRCWRPSASARATSPTPRCGTARARLQLRRRRRDRPQPGHPGGSALDHDGLARATRSSHSSGTRTSAHYNLVLGGETALMIKEELRRALRRAALHGRRRRLGRRDPAVRLRPEPPRAARRRASRSTPTPTWSPRRSTSATASCSSTTWTSPTAANPKWRELGRTASGSIGLNADATIPNPYRLGAPGNTRVRQRLARAHPAGAEPAVRHRRRRASSAWTRQRWRSRSGPTGTTCATSTASAPDGFARQTWDNVGVQYGLQALSDGNITPAEFLDLNARSGSWKDPEDMVQEGSPFVRRRRCPAERSTRGARATCNSAPTAAPRRRRGARATSRR